MRGPAAGSQREGERDKNAKPRPGAHNAVETLTAVVGLYNGLYWREEE